MPTLTFTEGSDSYTINTLDTVDFDLAFLGGDDTLTIIESQNNQTILAHMGNGNDRANVGFTSLSQVQIFGDAGNDRLDVANSTGADIFVDGGADDDLINLIQSDWSGLVTAHGGDGADRFNFGFVDSVLVDGGAGDDMFIGYWSPSGGVATGSIHGGAGNDYFVKLMGAGLELNLYGGIGNDLFRVNPSDPPNIVELAAEGFDAVQVARGADYTLPDNVEKISVQGFSGSDLTTATLIGNAVNNVITGHDNVETISGLGGNDNIWGKAGNDDISGGDGDDSLDGGDGNDALNGGSGSDVLQGRAGADTMLGGAGNDTYYVDSLADIVTELVGEGTDTVRVSVDGYVLADNAERAIVFGATGRTVGGNSLNNLVQGNSGADILSGGGGNDTVKGAAGQDALSGGLGADWLWGGAGNDTFRFSTVADSVQGSSDTIADFDSAFDVIDLAGIDANAGNAGDQAFTWNDTGSAIGVAGDLWSTSTFNADEGWYEISIFGDVNGDSLADLAFLVINDTSTLSEADFIL